MKARTVSDILPSLPPLQMFASGYSSSERNGVLTLSAPKYAGYLSVQVRRLPNGDWELRYWEPVLRSAPRWGTKGHSVVVRGFDSVLASVYYIGSGGKRLRKITKKPAKRKVA